MSRKSKLFISCLSIGLAASISSALASEDAVLFKIHDVVPIKNADGNVVSCDLGATFYNRTDKEISNAALNLVWADEVVAEAINQEERNIRESQRISRKNSPRYNTATYNSRNINLNLRLPTLKPHQQITLKSKVVTDRCFLLLDDMEVNITKCGIGDDVNAKSCANLFRFIGPKNAEYYSEFQKISVDQQVAQHNDKTDKQKQEVNSLYKEAINEINALSKQIKDARANVK